MCQGGAFNLSFQSLASRQCQDALKDLRKSDPDFYAELTQSDAGEILDIDETVKVPEDDVENSGERTV